MEATCVTKPATLEIILIQEFVRGSLNIGRALPWY